MRQSLRLGRIAGISVGLHWSVVVIMLLLTQGLAMVLLPQAAPGRSAVLYWSVALVFAALLLLALLAHEFAHALVARHYRMPVRRVTLWLLGGLAELEGEPPTPRADLFIALAGPLTSLATGLVAGAAAMGAGLLHLSALLVAPLTWFALVNVVLAVFNLLPGAPLDGGRVLRAIVWRVRGDKRAGQRAAARAGVGIGALLLAAAAIQIFVQGNLGGLWLALIGWFLISAAGSERTDADMRDVLGTVRVADIMSAPAVCGYDGQTVEAFVTLVARQHRYRSFPVIDFDGRVTGAVTLARLARVPREQRDTVRLRDVQIPAARLPVFAPEQPLIEAARAMMSGTGVATPVVGGGRLLGVVSDNDMRRALEMAQLGVPARPEPPTPAEPPLSATSGPPSQP
ncbi:MAG TPA: site-2 protease family protein [Micromonosporaceae bacterium]